MKAKAEMCAYACSLVVVSAHVLVKTTFILGIRGQPDRHRMTELQTPGLMKAVLLKCRLPQGSWVVLKLGAWDKEASVHGAVNPLQPGFSTKGCVLGWDPGREQAEDQSKVSVIKGISILHM